MNDDRCFFSKIKPLLELRGKMRDVESFVITFAGSTGVGKTRLIHSLFHLSHFEFKKNFVIHYETFLSFENERGEMREIRLEFRDTLGSEEEDRVRPLSYPESDLLIICLCPEIGGDCVTSKSIEEVYTRWYPELHHHTSAQKYVLEIERKEMKRRENIEIELWKRCDLTIMGSIIPEKENRGKMWEMLALVIEKELRAKKGTEVAQKKGFFSKLSKKKDKKLKEEPKVSQVRASDAVFVKKFFTNRFYEPHFPYNVPGVFNPSKFDEKF